MGVSSLLCKAPNIQYNETIGSRDTDARFKFSHLDSADRTRAIFREEYHKDDEEEKLVLAKYLTKKFKGGISVSHPKIFVRIRHYANDTFVPDMEPSWDAHEIKLNWVGMYTEWLKEEAEHSRRLHNFVSTQTNLSPQLIFTPFPLGGRHEKEDRRNASGSRSWADKSNGTHGMGYVRVWRRKRRYLEDCTRREDLKEREIFRSLAVQLGRCRHGGLQQVVFLQTGY